MLGRFFGAKLRAGVLYRIHERTGDRAALEEALKAYRRAREVWSQWAEAAKPVYIADIAAGELAWLRGNWADRLPAIDGDIADMAKRLESAKPGEPSDARARRDRRGSGEGRNGPQRRLPPHAAARTSVRARRWNWRWQPESGVKLAGVRLWYRRVTQGERWQSVEMQPGGGYRAAIPAAYTDSPFRCSIISNCARRAEKAWLYPGFGPELANQPYFVLRKS